ncbi:MAG: LysM peptidoglycan-binding domain-containing protein [Synechococcus sp. MED-G71]|nr:MAG: LysM peptidoglycan-binding domain-containing protein [Synechococcus sp. MED-G71]
MRKSLLALLLVAAALPLRAQETVHVMKPKQTLSAVSRLYGVPLKTLIRINGITNPNKIKIGTAIKLPAGTQTVSTSSSDLATRSRTAPETSTNTAAASTSDEAKEPKVMAKKTASADWRYYGPLQVDWNNWRSMAGSLVAPSLNKEGQPLYVAVNCGARKLNVTGPAGAWKTWEAPSEDFERDLVKAACLDPDLAKG